MTPPGGVRGVAAYGEARGVTTYGGVHEGVGW